VTLHNLVAALAVKAVLLAAYPLFLLATGFVEREDLLRGLAWAQGRVPASAPAIRLLRPLARLAPIRATSGERPANP
jgi:hypothetical protein